MCMLLRSIKKETIFLDRTKKIYFLHIPKSAGTSFYNYLLQFYNDELINNYNGLFFDRNGVLIE